MDTVKTGKVSLPMSKVWNFIDQVSFFAESFQCLDLDEEVQIRVSWCVNIWQISGEYGKHRELEFNWKHR